MKIGEWVRQYRKEHSLSMQAFGDLCGLSRAYISILEKEINPTTNKSFSPTIQTVLKIANVTGLDLNLLKNDQSPIVNVKSSDDNQYTPDMSIGKNIKLLREKYRLSQKDLALIAGVSDKAVSTWENGLKAPRMKSIQRITDHFGLKKSNLIEDDGMLSVINAPIKFSDNISNDDRELLDLYHRLDAEDRAEIRGEIKGMLKAAKYKSTIKSGEAI